MIDFSERTPKLTDSMTPIAGAQEVKGGDPLDVLLPRVLDKLKIDPLKRPDFKDTYALGQWIKKQVGEEDLGQLIKALSQPHSQNKALTEAVDRVFSQPGQIGKDRLNCMFNLAYALATTAVNPARIVLTTDARPTDPISELMSYTPYARESTQHEPVAEYINGMAALTRREVIQKVYNPENKTNASENWQGQLRRAYLQLILSGTGLMPLRSDAFGGIRELGKTVKPGAKIDPHDPDIGINIISPIIGRSTY